MSRTYRHRAGIHAGLSPKHSRAHRALGDWRDYYDPRCRGRYAPSCSQQEALARVHADRGLWNAPAWFRREHNNRYRLAARAELLRCLYRDAWDRHLTVGFTRDACWYAW